MSVTGAAMPAIPSRLSMQWPDGTTRTVDAMPPGSFGPLQSFAGLLPQLEQGADLSARLRKEAEAGLAASREQKIEGAIYRKGRALVTFYEGNSVGMPNALSSKLSGDRITQLGLNSDRLTIGQKIEITLRELGIDERDVSTYDLSNVPNGPRVRDGADVVTEDGLKAFLKHGHAREDDQPALRERLSAATLFETMQRSQGENRVGGHP